MTVAFGRVKKLENISKRLSTTSHEDDFVKCLCSSYQVNFIFIFCSFGFLGRFLNRYLSSASDWLIFKIYGVDLIGGQFHPVSSNLKTLFSYNWTHYYGSTQNEMFTR